MTSIHTREDALELVQDEHQRVRDFTAKLRHDDLMRPNTIRRGLYPKQEMSIKDLVGHLTMWEIIAIEAIEEWRQHKTPWILDPIYKTAEGGRTLNFDGIEQRKSMTLEEVMAEWEHTQATLETVIADLTTEGWDSHVLGQGDQPLTVGDMLEDILTAPRTPPFRHFEAHVPDTSAFIHRLQQGD